MKKHKRILAFLVQARYNLRVSVNRDDELFEAMTVLFGKPNNCLVCGMDISGQNPPKDLDSWFCSKCCPVCN